LENHILHFSGIARQQFADVGKSDTFAHECGRLIFHSY